MGKCISLFNSHIVIKNTVLGGTASQIVNLGSFMVLLNKEGRKNNVYDLRNDFFKKLN